MLSLYGKKVAVFESHTHCGGCAHGFSVRVPSPKKKAGGQNGGAVQDGGSNDGSGEYIFDTGPSFFSGLNAAIEQEQPLGHLPVNPLRTILDAIEEEVECIPYSTFGLKFPEGDFIHSTQFGKSKMNKDSDDSTIDYNVIQQIAGNEGVRQWNALMDEMSPLAKTVELLPTIALRTDVGVALSISSFMPDFMRNSIENNPLSNLKLTRPFADLVVDDAKVTNDFITNWLDLLCFCLSGLPASGTITAEMAMMMGEFYDDGATMDCPVGGARSIVEALRRGVVKNGGEIFCNSHVERVKIVDGVAVGVTLRKGGQYVVAKEAVVSNLSVWDLFKSGIVDCTEFPKKFVEEKLNTPVGKSFMHLHVGFRCSREELESLQAHYMYIDDWDRGVEAEDNAVLVSIPSVHDDTLAPPGHAVLHIYTPATESYERWRGVDRKSDEYKALKQERSEYLWQVLEKLIPDIRDRSTVAQVGTPLTHERFLRRYEGSYGPAIKAGQGSFPFPGTPVKNLLLCGDSCFPGIGVPAVAGSGLLAAHSVSLDSLGPQLEVLDKLQQKVKS